MPRATPRALERLASPPFILGWALALRLAAVAAVERHVRGKVPPFVFPDSKIYWYLADRIRSGSTYVVPDWGVPHYALRTPGYPLFWAACQAVFGPTNFVAVRLVQALLGVLCVWVVARLVATIRPEDAGPGWSVPAVAMLWAATDPYTVAIAPLLLSEAVFVPLMLLALWGQAAAWDGPGDGRGVVVALGAGVAHGAAVLARPSWAPIVPGLLLGWLILAGRGRRLGALRGAALVMLGLVVAMGPWWVRNTRVFGRFVPTALWAGASLYDGLRPDADGSSDMRFMEDPAIRTLPEVEQDARLARMALDFARSHPGRVAELAVLKAARFWSPWPNEASFRRPVAVVFGSLVTLPFYVFMAIGTWDRLRARDGRALLLLLGPLLGTAALHMVFVGSLRYRVPVTLPAFGLAALGACRWSARSL